MNSPVKKCSELAKALRASLRVATIGAVLPLMAISHMAAAETLNMGEGTGAVGQVSMVLGRAFLESPGGERHQIVSGMLIKAKDRILTDTNGHVHIRFVDEALVSIRPSSRLDIQQYDYSADQPGQSAIRLNLEEGVTRSISGRGATEARERFRMNTPIAAIGVRGTDFVVSASQSSVRAMVNEGAIVLAPYSSDCMADAFGPCMSGGVELSNGGLAVLQMEGGHGAQLMPSSVERDPDMMREEVNYLLSGTQSASSIDASAEVNATAEDKTAGTGVFLENVTAHQVKEQVIAAARPGTPKPETPAPVEPETPVLPDFTPEVPVTMLALSERNLIWGRWGAGQGANERITTDYASARDGRDVTIGNREYALFRDGNGVTQVDRGLGEISFGLHSAQAFYSSDEGVFTMSVRSGELGINFNTNQFATSLNLNHELTGDVNFSASGLLRPGGFFYTNSDTERMAGAVSLDGKEAGYFFEKQLDIGGIKGLTLWDRRGP